MKANAPFLLLAFLAALAIALPVFAYEYPLTSAAIRDAYFAGTGSRGTNPTFYAQYIHSLSIPIPSTGTQASDVSIETPYLKIVKHARQTLNYDAQQAVKDFFNKPMTFSVYIYVYFTPEISDPDVSYSPEPLQGMKVKLIQNDKEIVPKSVQSDPLYPIHDAWTLVTSNGEQVQLDINGEKIDSSPLTVKIDTPDDQHAETTFDLAKVK